MSEDIIVPLSAKDMGILVDTFKEIEQKRLAADKVAAKLKEQETQLKQEIILQCKLQETNVFGGKEFKVERSTTDEPQVDDWAKFQAYILKTKDFSLLERRPGRAAIKERWADKKVVPGVIKFPVDKLSFTKLKG